jgi:hypothetical protein
MLSGDEISQLLNNIVQDILIGNQGRTGVSQVLSQVTAEVRNSGPRTASQRMSTS